MTNQNELEAQMRQIAEQVYLEKGTRFQVANVPIHQHNTVDTTTIPPNSVDGFLNLPGGTGGVVSPDALGNQVVTQGYTKRAFGTLATVSQATFPVFPVTIVGGGGSSTTLTLTGTPAAGATSATLTAPFGGTTGTYATAFTSTEIKMVSYTNGSTAVSWSTPLKYSGGGAGISLNGDSTFNGGDAPPGTVIIFSAQLALNPQLWVRVDSGSGVEKWWGVDLTTGIIGFTA